MKLNVYGNMPIMTPRDPQLPMEAANKNYVDNRDAAHAADLTLHLTTAQNTLLDNLTVTFTEVNRLAGVTANVQTQIDSKIAKSGDTMTGFLTLSANPTQALHAATRGYVDANWATVVQKAGDTMTGALTLSGNPSSALHATPKQYVDAGISAHATDATLHLTAAQNTFLDGVTATSTEVNYLVGAGSNIQTQIDTKLSKAGGLMTGLLSLSGDPALPLNAVTKQYVDNKDALKVSKAGDTMTGALVLPGNPTAALEAAPKQYVDAATSTHASDTSLHLTSAQNTFLDAVTVTSTEVNYLGGVTSGVQSQLDSKVSKAGATMTGLLVLSADPAVALGAATKQYTDAADALAVKKAGDTMTGSLTLSGAPTVTLHAATKGYVDTGISTHATDAALHLTTAQNTWLDAITASSTEVNYLVGVTSAIQSQLNSKLNLSGGSMTGDLTMGATNAVFVSKVPVAGNELVNKTYVDSLINGKKWEDPVSDINLVADNLSAPPGSPVTNDVYIIGAAPTGAWATKAGYATYWNGTAWVFLQARAVAVGDRFGVSLTSATVAAGGLVGKDDSIVTITNATPGAVTYSTDTINAGSTTMVFDPDSSKFGVSYTRTDEGTWVPTNTSVNISDGAGLSFAGNILNVNFGKGVYSNNDAVEIKLDATTGIGFDGSNNLVIKRDGATISASSTGIKVADTVIADIADKVSKTTASTVTAVITVGSTGGLKTQFTPTVAADVVNKGYVDTADAALQTQITADRTDINVLKADPVTKTYVDTQDGTKLSKAGGTMTGAIVLAGNPAAALEAAPKQYVDSGISTHASDVSLHLTSAQNTWLDAITASAVEVNRLVGVTSAVQTQLDSKLALAGGTMTGLLVLSADPAVALGAATKQYTDAASALAVKKAGDTMTGSLTLSGAPTSNLHAATKAYVDSGLSTHSTDLSMHLSAAQNTFLDGSIITFTEANYLSGVTSAVQTQLNAKLPLAGGTMTGNLILDVDPTNPLGASTKQYVDNKASLKVNKAGDTMTGPLIMAANPTVALEAATKGYIDTNLGSHAADTSLHITAAQNTFLDGLTIVFAEANRLAGVTSNVQAQIDSKLNLSGGTLTGALTLSADPISAMQAATKQYTDTKDTLKVSKAGDTMTGSLILAADPTALLEAATKQYVDTKDATRKTYIDNADATKVSKAGDTMTGLLVLSADPAAALGAATKQYVDTKDTTQKTYIDTADANLQSQVTTLQGTVSTLNADPVTKSYVNAQDATKLAIAGGTMTGYVTLHADPQQSMHPATKQYVDAVAQGLSTKPSVRFASTGNVTATYNNGTAGVNSTLTGTVNGALVIDGGTPVVGDRVLIKDQTVKAQNGDYAVQQVGGPSAPFILKRVTTIDESSEVPGSFFYVYDGTQKGTGWVFTVANPITYTIGVDDIIVNQFSGAGSIIAGDGMTMNGNVVQVNSANPARIVVNADNIDLAVTGVTPGSYTRVTVDGYGRATAGSNPNTLAGYGITDGQPLNANLTSLSAVSSFGILVRDTTNTLVVKSIGITGNGLSITNSTGALAGNISIVSSATEVNTPSAIVLRDASGNFAANVITASLTGNATTATTLQTTRTFAVTGDITAPSVNFNGGANVGLVATLAPTGVAAGTYTQVTVNTKGQVTVGANPNTAAGYGITDVYTKSEVDTLVATLRKEFNELYLYALSRI